MQMAVEQKFGVIGSLPSNIVSIITRDGISRLLKYTIMNHVLGYFAVQRKMLINWSAPGRALWFPYHRGLVRPSLRKSMFMLYVCASTLPSRFLHSFQQWIVLHSWPWKPRVESYESFVEKQNPKWANRQRRLFSLLLEVILMILTMFTMGLMRRRLGSEWRWLHLQECYYCLQLWSLSPFYGSANDSAYNQTTSPRH